MEFGYLTILDTIGKAQPCYVLKWLQCRESLQVVNNLLVSMNCT